MLSDLNHGIYGGAYLFNRLMKKPLHMRKEQLYIKAVCMCIAQHNIFKSTSDEIDQKLDEYLSLEKLKHNSDFKINEEYPLLLFLSLVDTIECVKNLVKVVIVQVFYKRKRFFQMCKLK